MRIKEIGFSLLIEREVFHSHDPKETDRNHTRDVPTQKSPCLKPAQAFFAWQRGAESQVSRDEAPGYGWPIPRENDADYWHSFLR
jgi:hypothetical protein